MKFYEFGCAPQAVKDGFSSSVTIFRGTTAEVEIEYLEQDVAVVYGAKFYGTTDQFEFGILKRALNS